MSAEFEIGGGVTIGGQPVSGIAAGSDIEIIVQNGIATIVAQTLEEVVNEINPIAWWRYDRGMVSAPSSVAQKDGNTFSSWISSNMQAPVAGQLDPYGTTGASKVLETAAFNQHGLAQGVFGTKHPGVSAGIRAFVAPIGGRYIWIFDGNDGTPEVKVSPAGVLTVVAGANVLATATLRANGFIEIEVISRDWLLDAANNTGIFTGDAASSNIAGDITKGYYVYDVTAIENEAFLRCANQIAGGAELQHDAAMVPEYFLERGEIWAPPALYGLCRVSDATIAACFAQNTGRATLFFLIDPQVVPAAATSTVLTNATGSSLSWGFAATTAKIWAGVFGVSGGTTIDPVPVGKHLVAMTWDGHNVAIYVDGQLALNPTPAVVGAPNQLVLAVTNNMGWQHAVLADTVVDAAQIARISWALLSAVGGPSPTLNDIWSVWNPVLWSSHPHRRLAFAEAVFEPEPAADSVTLTWRVDIPFMTISSHSVIAIADGVVIGSTAGVNGTFQQTYAMPINTKRLVIRDGQIGDVAVHSFSQKVAVEGRLLPEPMPTWDIRFFGDSVLNGFLAPTPAVQSYAMILRDSAPAGTRLSVWGWGGYMLATEGSTAGARTTLVNELTLDIAATARVTVGVVIGINDANTNSFGSLANYLAAFEDFIDKIHAAVPIAQVLIIGQHTCIPDGTQAPYRAAMLGCAATRPWSLAVDLSTISVPIEPTDVTGLHPTPVGFTNISSLLKTILGIP
jgi:hypothetical protein